MHVFYISPMLAGSTYFSSVLWKQLPHCLWGWSVCLPIIMWILMNYFMKATEAFSKFLQKKYHFYCLDQCPLDFSTEFRVHSDSVHKLWGQKDIGSNPNCVTCMIWCPSAPPSSPPSFIMFWWQWPFFLSLTQAKIIFHLDPAISSNVTCFPNLCRVGTFSFKG